MAAELERVYTCPTYLIAAKFDLDAYSASERWQFCRRASALIDQWTNQWFNGEPGPFYLDGRDSPLLEHKSRINIPYVESITVIGERTHQRRRPITDLGFNASGCFSAGEYLVPSEEWVKRDRAIFRTRSTFPGGEMNIRVEGVLGHVAAFKRVETVSTTAVTTASTTVTVDDVSGFSPRDVVDLVADDLGARVIITAVNRGTKQLTFDALGVLLDTIPVGAVVRTFGKVPSNIELIAAYAFGVLQRQLTDGGAQPIDEGRIKRERTDDYEYELFDPSLTGAQSSATGNKFYDLLLRGFCAPGGVKVIGG